MTIYDLFGRFGYLELQRKDRNLSGFIKSILVCEDQPKLYEFETTRGLVNQIMSFQTFKTVFLLCKSIWPTN